ncbi:hypothetical protein [Pedobacter sp.]|uniref:hypothetical protein n=1 Tax=Pedobacter sp. TaxID=1411316 RepID=UPI003D7F1B0B
MKLLRSGIRPEAYTTQIPFYASSSLANLWCDIGQLAVGDLSKLGKSVCPNLACPETSEPPQPQQHH